jgi:hypothetical protein
MIWVMIALNLGLPIGQISKDEMLGRAFHTEAQCLNELLAVNNWLVDRKLTMNLICFQAKNTPTKGS